LDVSKYWMQLLGNVPCFQLNHHSSAICPGFLERFMLFPVFDCCQTNSGTACRLASNVDYRQPVSFLLLRLKNPAEHFRTEL
ncbi:hypothetical protein X801_06581, partial [Opisthorchis viverrini]